MHNYAITEYLNNTNNCQVVNETNMVFTGHTGTIVSVHFSYDDKYLVSGAEDK